MGMSMANVLNGAIFTEAYDQMVQVAETLQEALQPRGVAVLLEAAHFCMMMRGVEKQNSKTTTSALIAEFCDFPALRSEFMAAVRGGGNNY